MTPFTLLIAVLPALALASPAPARGGANSAVGPLSCVTSTDVPFWATSNTKGGFRGMYGVGVSVYLKCYKTGEIYEGNSPMAEFLVEWVTHLLETSQGIASETLSRHLAGDKYNPGLIVACAVLTFVLTIFVAVMRRVKQGYEELRKANRGEELPV
ncbi:hypothetical protein FN846DRAFT_922447 [Sphaerosporella brunnea]|uniref:Uncharacterized protein n=1 Tax=Sphaerosporella brunnea TaxID=1250544 RepID=A0A5J5EJA7_9PEZI|nr:hypothetical protein FN846DRAFT_922447 [Sphaerosporella brunnea]